MISAECRARVEFYDLDPMNIMWHGHYVKLFEQARCVLLEQIDYTYADMTADGYVFPIADMRVKFVQPARFAQDLVITATVIEYENRLKIAYEVRDVATGTVLTKGHTIQVTVRLSDATTRQDAMDGAEMEFVCPPQLIAKMEAAKQ